MSKHALLSPSRGAMWTRCPGAIAYGRNAVGASSEYAAEGSAYHWVAAETLTKTKPDGGIEADCSKYVGRLIDMDDFTFTVDAENAAFAQIYVDAICRLPGMLYVEQWLDLSTVLGVPDQGGTGDAITVDDFNKVLHVDDLKFGRGETVYAEDNEQLILYAAGALQKFGLIVGLDWRVKIGIHQPRIGHYDEHYYTQAEIIARVARYATAAQQAYLLYQDAEADPQLDLADWLVPGEKQCRWCPMRAVCPARGKEILSQFPIVGVTPPLAELSDATLADQLRRVDDIELWCRDTRAEALRRALAGRTLSGWKVVVGRRGTRRWSADASTELELYLGEDAYQKTIISPTEAERQLSKHHPDLWTKLQAKISQADGSKHLAPDQDPREALAISTQEFPHYPVEGLI